MAKPHHLPERDWEHGRGTGCSRGIGSTLCPSCSSQVPPGFGCRSVNLLSFPSRKNGCGRGRTRPTKAGGDGPSGMFGRAGNVLGVMTTHHPLGSPVLLGMETTAKGGGLGPWHRAGAQARSVPMLLGWRFPARRCWPGMGPTLCTNLGHPRDGETEAQLESGPVPSHPRWVPNVGCRSAPSCGAGQVPGPAARFGTVLPSRRARWVPVGQRRVGTMNHPHRIPQGASTASHVQLHPLAAAVSSQLMRQPRAERIQDRDEDPFALPILGKAFICFYICCKQHETHGAGTAAGCILSITKEDAMGHRAFLA